MGGANISCLLDSDGARRAAHAAGGACRCPSRDPIHPLRPPDGHGAICRLFPDVFANDQSDLEFPAQLDSPLERRY